MIIIIIVSIDLIDRFLFNGGNLNPSLISIICSEIIHSSILRRYSSTFLRPDY